MQSSLLNFFHFVSFGMMLDKSGNDSDRQCLSHAEIFYELTSYGVGSLQRPITARLLDRDVGPGDDRT
jgi:hypothetical protein